jgi:hypothetical protein
MRKKEIWILDCIQTDIADNNEQSARNFVKEHDNYIFSKKRSKEFDQQFFKLNDQLGWGLSLSDNFELSLNDNSDYYNQINNFVDEPEGREF